MANTTKNLVRFPIGKEGRMANLPVKGSTHIYEGAMVAQIQSGASIGQLVTGTTALGGQCVGISTHEVDSLTVPVADGIKRCLIETDRVHAIPNATGADACSEATPFGSVVYMKDDQTVADNSSGDTRKPAGYFWGMEEDGKVKVWITAKAITGALDVGQVTNPPAVRARGRTTADVADLNAFTVAGVDGLTYVAGERVFLPAQTAPAQNGVYLVGTVAGGVAPLTRTLDADGATEIVAGMVVLVSEGTTHADTAWKLDTNDQITIGTTSLTFTQIPYGWGGAAAVADVDKSAESAGTSNLAARIDHKHDISTAAASGLTSASTSAEGAAASLARSNHTHAITDLDGRSVASTANDNLVGGLPVVHKFILPAGATGDASFVLTHKEEIIDVYLVKTTGAGGGAGTYQLRTAAGGGGTAVTNTFSIDIADTTVARMTTLDDAVNEFAAGASLHFRRVRTASSDESAIAYVSAIRKA